MSSTFCFMWLFEIFNSNQILFVEYLLSFNKSRSAVMAKINTNFIKTLQYKGKNYRVWDDVLKGFGISIQKDSMSFILQYRNQYGQQKYYTIGRVGILTADEARKIAKDKLAGITKNEDPASERQEDKSALTINQLCDWYLKSGIAHKKPKTIIDNQSSIKNHIRPLLGNMPIKTINRGLLEQFVIDVTNGDKVKIRAKSDKARGLVVVRGGKFAAKKAIELLSAMFEFAISHNKLDKNPAHGVKTQAYNARNVFLNLDEIRQFGELLSDPVVYSEHQNGVNALKLLLLTGCRKSEITTLKWEYIDFNEHCFRFPDTKTGKQNRPFGAGAEQFLQKLYDIRDINSPFVFPAARQSKDGHLVGLSKMFKSIVNTIDENGNLRFQKPGLTIHALRHTFASMGEYLEHSPLIIAGLLGHKQKQMGVTGRYLHVVDKSLLNAANDISLEILKALTQPES